MDMHKEKGDVKLVRSQVERLFVSRHIFTQSHTAILLP